MRYMVVTIARSLTKLNDLAPGRYVREFNEKTSDSAMLHELLCSWFLTEYTVKFTDIKPRGAQELGC